MRKSTITLLDPAKTRPEFKPPANLPKATHAHYLAICNHLWDGGRFHPTDALLVAQYVLAHYEADQARARYVAEGLTVEAVQGPKAHPMLAVANQARTTVAKLASTLGLGPMHRHRIAVTVEADSDTGAASGWHSRGATR